MPSRTVEDLSMFNPLSYGDILELDGPDGGEPWHVDRSAYGWYLHKFDEFKEVDVHPSIHSIDGMADFIYAILEWSKAYAK